MSFLVFILLFEMCICHDGTFNTFDHEDPPIVERDLVVADGEIIDLLKEPEVSRELYEHELLTRQNSVLWYSDYYKELVDGLTTATVFSRSSPSRLVLFGENAFPIAQNIRGDVVCGGAIYGKGRIVALPRLEHATKAVIPEFLQNALPWLAQKQMGIKVANSRVREHVYGTEFEDIGYVKPSELNTTQPDVYFINAHVGVPDSDLEHVLNFVNNGGGLLVAGQAWAWKSYHRKKGQEFADSYPGNRLLSKFGLLITDYNHGTAVFSPSAIPPLEINVFYALKAVIENPQYVNSAVPRALVYAQYYLLREALIGMPEFETIMSLSIEAFEVAKDLDLSLMTNRDIHNSLMKGVVPYLLLAGKEELIQPASNVNIFPYELPATAQRVEKTIAINGNYSKGYPGQFKYSSAGSPKMISTGLYAGAGDIITVSVDEKVVNQDYLPEVQIGVHRDTLYGRTKERSPDLIFTYTMKKPITKATNPWGGLVIIRIPYGKDVGQFNVTISNAVLAPRFILGETSLQDWKNEIRDYPAPWTELEVPEQIIFSVPSFNIRELDNPHEFLAEYEKVMSLYNYLLGFEDNFRYRAERFVFDIQISMGWMHSGYPMMGFVSAVPHILDVDQIRSAKNWGILHEIGHNSQWNAYNVGGVFDEAGCNFFAYHATRKLYNSVSKGMLPSMIDYRLSGWVMRGKPIKEWHSNYVVITYARLFDVFGWDSFRSINKLYQKILEAGTPIIRHHEKVDYFVRFYAQVVQTNVCPYFQWFQQQLSQETLDICESYPAMTFDLTSRFDGAIWDENMEHRNCSEGWIPFGEDCYFFSMEERNWNDAEVMCNEAGEDSHIASCLTTPQAYFLKKSLDDNKMQGLYYVGIDKLHEDYKPRFINGELIKDKLLPWNFGQPSQNIVRQCTRFRRGLLEDELCYHNNKYICKKGPTSCGPATVCPEGWHKKGSKCYLFDVSAIGKFDEAVTNCQELGGNLLEIHSESEQVFVRTILNNFRWHKGNYYWRHYWLGMNNTLSDQWMSGEDIVYTNWCEGRPADVPYQTILQANKYCWGQRIHKNIAGYICEKVGTFLEQ